MAGYDVTQDTRDTLAAYLTTELLTLLGADKPVTVRSTWPGAREDLPERCVTLVALEEPPDVRFWPPTEWEPPVPDLAGSPSGQVRYTWGRYKLNLQMDVWARFADVRTELVKALDSVLHRHPQVTLPGGDGFQRPARWHELALASAGLPGCVVYYRFAPAQPPTESGQAVQSGEFRLSWPGSAQGLLTTEEACAILRNLSVTQTVGEGTERPADTFTVEP